MPISDELIGRNLARMRGDMSQKELAARMKELGWRWSQATVWSVEKGERPLSLAEAEDVKRVLGTLWSLTMDDADTSLVMASRNMAEANRDLEAAIERFYGAQLELKVVLEDSQSPRLREHVGEWLEHSVESVAAHTRKKMQLAEEMDHALYTQESSDSEQHPEAP